MKKTITISFIIMLCAGLFIGDFTLAQGGNVVVIISRSRAALNRSQIKKIFTGDMTRWPDGKSIKVLINKDNAVYDAFCKKYLNKASSTIEGIWLKKKVREGKALPRKVSSTIIKMMIANSDIFIGFLEDGELSDKIKIIR